MGRVSCTCENIFFFMTIELTFEEMEGEEVEQSVLNDLVNANDDARSVQAELTAEAACVHGDVWSFSLLSVDFVGVVDLKVTFDGMKTPWILQQLFFCRILLKSWFFSYSQSAKCNNELVSVAPG